MTCVSTSEEVKSDTVELSSHHSECPNECGYITHEKMSSEVSGSYDEARSEW